METSELNILYEDNHIIVVLKPQMVACCPDESGDSNLFDCVKEYLKVTYNKQGNAYLGLIHRLDRPTGGVMVFAKTSKAAARLSEQMRSGGFEKKYFAVLCGVPSKKRATLENYLRKNSVNNTVYVATFGEEGAKFAKLDYEVKATERGLSLAEITLHTGRTHQIRVHAKHLNHPVVGDEVYGRKKREFNLNGQLLHACRLELTHPTSGKRMVFTAPLPDYFAAVLRKLNMTYKMP